MFWDSTLLLLVPVMIFAMWAQHRVKSTYREFLAVPAARGLTGREAARRLLDAAGLHDVGIETVDGELSDHYDPRARVLRLSRANDAGRSISALGVACHEAGHALQHAAGYAPLNIRQAIWPVTSFGSGLAMPLFFIGFLFQFPALMDVGIAFYAVAAFFALVTLPVEFDASRRAVTLLNGHGIVTAEESGKVSRVLNAAALTYVAGALMAVVQLVRLLILRDRR
ncbi:MAG TPA: zinc metallopeptidase [Candidatus Krumholzibacteria bacterium]|nr:zinc metallopeptidase [Candidatus Krumholzibacteria bacterium]HRX49950.1 zinc metallopeptidase [Candidatus Krumholzibacteria bacterium]